MEKLYKIAVGYYQLHRELLLSKGYTISEDNEEYTKFEKPQDGATTHNRQTDGGVPTTTGT